MLDFTHVIDWLQQWLGTAVYYFVFVTFVDIGAGVVLALRQNLLRQANGRFDWAKLPSFLASQYGARQSLALLGLVVTAALAPSASKDIAGAARDVLVVGFATFGTKIAADATLKALAIFGIGPVAL